MNEILRLSHISTDSPGNFRLRDFNLTISSGEVIYLYANTDVEKYVLIDILTGVRQSYEGTVHLYRKPQKWSSPLAYENRIFFVDEKRQLIPQFSVMENICTMGKISPADVVIPRVLHQKRTKKLLEFLHLLRMPQESVEQFSHFERQLVCIAKMLYRGAKILLLDGTENSYNMREILHLKELILKLSGQGIAVVLFQRQPAEMLPACTKCVLMREGSDSKILFPPEITKEIIGEYRVIHTHIRVIPPKEEGEKQPFGFCKEKLSLEMEKPFIQQKKSESSSGRIMGYYDLGIDSNVGFMEYIERLGNGQMRKALRERSISHIVDEDKRYMIIKANSAYEMLENLDLAENLDIYFWSLSPRKKVMLQKNYSQYLRRSFLQKFGLDEELKELRDLTYYERKLLSIYRWLQIGSYDTIVLEEPYLNLQGGEVEGMGRYLEEISEVHAPLQLFSKNAVEMVKICDSILLSYNGKFIKDYEKKEFAQMMMEAPQIIRQLI